MRWSARRTLIGAAVLLAGIVGLNQTTTMEAADPVPDNDFKALFEQDAKNIPDMIAMGKKGGAANTSKASRATKSNAMMIAYFANTRISGKNPMEDAKMAELRDTALKVALAGGKKKFADAEGPAKLLSLSITPGKGPAKAMTLEDMKKAGEMDLEELMYQFKKTSVGGLGVEEDIKANAKKLTMAPDKVSVLAERVLAVVEYSEIVGLAQWDAKKTKKDWDVFNKDTRKAAQDLQAAASSKDAKKIQTAFDKLDRTCTACHEKMK